jgi:NADPH2:quinone reductase
MKVVTLEEFGSPPAVRDDLEAPTPGEGEVLVRVHASSANPVDNAIAAGMLKEMFDHDFPVTLGRDYCGVVEQVGSGVDRFQAGDEVFGFLKHADPTVHEGTWAELITVPEDASIAPKPDGVGRAAAGAAPLAAITAMTAVDALDLSEGSTVLVVGATGGVGSFAVQLAAKAGATVIAPALAQDEDYLRDLGAAEVIGREEDVASAVRERHGDGVEAVLDLVSYEPGAFDAALKPEGRVASSNSAAGEGPGRTNVMAAPTTQNLERLGSLLADGTLRVPLQESHQLERAPAALQALGSQHTVGKLGIEIA